MGRRLGFCSAECTTSSTTAARQSVATTLCESTESSLPARAQRLVDEWAAGHEAELVDDWRPYVTHYYKIWLWAGDLIVVDGTLDNGDGHFGWTCAGNDLYFLNSNGPLVYTAPSDGYYYMNIYSHERGGDYNVAVTVVPYYISPL